MKIFDLNKIPIGQFNWYSMIMWCYYNDIGSAKERFNQNNGVVDYIEMSDEEALLFYMKWGIKL